MVLRAMSSIDVNNFPSPGASAITSTKPPTGKVPVSVTQSAEILRKPSESEVRPQSSHERSRQKPQRAETSMGFSSPRSVNTPQMRRPASVMRGPSVPSFNRQETMKKKKEVPVLRRQSSFSLMPRSKENLLDIDDFDFATRGMTQKQIDQIFLAKCTDFKLQPTPERKSRFYELLDYHCDNERLHLPDSGFQSNGSIALAKVLAVNKYFAWVNLRNNVTGDDGATAFGKALETNETITQLDLASNDIGINGTVALLTSLQDNVTLTDLDLSAESGVNRNRLGTRGSNVLSSVLSYNPVLTKLNVNSCGIHPEGAVALSDGLKTNSSLVWLDLGTNFIGNEGVKKIVAALKDNNTLQQLRLERNKITDAGAKAIGTLLSSNTCLTVLDVSGNRISDAGMSAIGASLEFNRTLTVLNAKRNAIGHEGITSLCMWLKRDDSVLKTLLLGGNKVNVAGAIEVADCLRNNESLTRLDVSSNEISDQGAATLSNSVHGNKTLISLDLSNNGITDEGGGAIAHMLRKNETLQIIRLKNNNLKDSSTQAIANSLSYNTTVQKLDLTYNNVEYRSAQVIESILKENERLYKQNASQRLLKDIEALEEDEKRYEEVQSQLVDEVQKRKENTELLERMKSELEELEGEEERVVSELTEDLGAISADVLAEEKCSRDLHYKTNRLRSEKEGKLRLQTVKVTSQVDTRNRFEKNARARQNEMTKLTHEHEDEMEDLLSELARLQDQVDRMEGDFEDHDRHLQHSREKLERLEEMEAAGEQVSPLVSPPLPPIDDSSPSPPPAKVKAPEPIVHVRRSIAPPKLSRRKSEVDGLSQGVTRKKSTTARIGGPVLEGPRVAGAPRASLLKANKPTKSEKPKPPQRGKSQRLVRRSTVHESMTTKKRNADEWR